jgi:hypothetical protein
MEHNAASAAGEDIVNESTIFGMVVTILAVGLSLGIVPLGIYFDHRKRRMLFEERRLMIERGMQPPPFTEPKPFPFNQEPRMSRDPKAVLETCFRRGLILAFLGAGLWLGDAVLNQRLTTLDGSASRADWLVASGSLAATGIVLGLLGAGNLVYYALARARSRQA